MCFWGFMGVADTGSVPDPIEGADEYWITTITHVEGDPKPIKTTVFRPKWEQTWSDNKTAWIVDMVDLLRESGKEYTTYALKPVSQTELEKALKSVFLSLVKRWKAQQDTPAKDAQTRKGMYKARKANVSASDIIAAGFSHLLMQKLEVRQEVIDEGHVPGLKHPRYLFFRTHWHYHSSDESSEEQVLSTALDPNTEDEGAGGSSAVPMGDSEMRTVWTSHAPAHRTKKVGDCMPMSFEQTTSC